MSAARIYDLIVIGGGAAGFFGAIQAAEKGKAKKILILEKSSRLLQKVKVSGGGRCNVTHHCYSPSELSRHYPRGERTLKNLFHYFHAGDTVAWFESHGVNLKAEDDGRMFPTTDDSQTIIDCFLRAAGQFDIEIKTQCEVIRLEKKSTFEVVTPAAVFEGKNVLVSIGGFSKPEGYAWLRSLGIDIAAPIPSLFTFNDSKKDFSNLMGVSVENGEVKIAGTKYTQKGAVLITHWGLSGPAVIKLSSWAAEYLHHKSYTFTALINWTGMRDTEIRESLLALRDDGSKKQVVNTSMFNVPKRLWEMVCIKAEVEPAKIWAEMSNKQINRMVEWLTACPFHIKGKTTFKEEFVTCGGVMLDQIQLPSMESKKIPGLYFAGEVLNIDGETGGFNFQAAWTTGYLAANALR